MNSETPLSPTASAEPTYNDGKTTFWVWIVAALVMLLTLIPYLIGNANAQGRTFTWLGGNLVDSTVYLAWMRQAADGRLMSFDPFTTEPQAGMLINPFFLLLGNVARFTGLSLFAVYQAARLVCGFGLLMVVWAFIRETVAEKMARWFAFLFVAFSAGFGWIPAWWQITTIDSPIDKWQDEALTFRSLYLSPLFCVSLLLQVGIFLLLLRADRSGRVRPAIGAGICGLLLALVHPYNIVSEALVWGVYLLFNLIKPPVGYVRGILLRNGLIAGGLTLPGVLYMAWQLRRNPIFQATRPHEPSVSLFWVAVGYGLPLLLAIIAAFVLRRRSPASSEASDGAPFRSFVTGADATRLLLCWLVFNVAAAYLPVAFQRRVLQGAHFPIALLAGIGAAWLLARLGKGFACMAYLLMGGGLWFLTAKWEWGIGAQFMIIAGLGFLCYLEIIAPKPNGLRVAVALTVFLGLTNFLFLHGEVETFQAAPDSYLKAGEIEALQWVREHTPPDAVVQPISQMSLESANSVHLTDHLARFVPMLTGRRVYYGHEAETIRFPEKQHDVVFSCSAQATEEQRVALWHTMNIRYLIFTQKEPGDEIANQVLPMFRGLLALSPHLNPVFHNDVVDVYEVLP